MLTATGCFVVSLSAEDSRTFSSVSELWKDREVFLPEFFPEMETLSADDIFIEGLKNRFPNRIHREMPELEPGPAESPRIETLMEGVNYVRVYDLGRALSALEDLVAASTLVVDLRHVQAGRDDTLALGALLALNETVELSLSESAAGNEANAEAQHLPIQPAGLRRPLQPVFVLTNRETAGPVETLLAELKDKGQIISIGTPTAGKTGSFRRVLEEPPLYVLSSELRPSSGDSLLETGFVPAVRMTVSPDQDRKAYEAMEEGKSILALVGADGDNDEPPPEPGELRELLDREESREPDENSEPVDTILQRAYFIATALKSMGKIAPPESN